jgi:hypothetical protein
VTSTRANSRQDVAGTQLTVWVLCVIDAGLLVASGVIHLHFWDIAYRHVATLGPLFLVQLIAAFVVAVALVVTRKLIMVAAAFLLMGGTIIGFILVRTVGLFGFKLTFTSGLAATVLVIEAVAVVLTAITAWVISRRERVAGRRLSLFS